MENKKINVEETIKNDLHQYLTSIDRVDQHLPEAPDLEAFPSLKIAIDCGKAGGTLPCAFNAANEEAVYAFLAGKIKYLDIPYITATVTAQHNNVLRPQLEDIEATDAWARAAAQGVIAKL